MTKIARLAAAVLCLVAVLAAGLPSGACAPAAAPSDPKEAVVAAYKNLQALQTCHMSYSQEIVMTVGRQKTVMLTVIESDIQQKPLLCRSTITFTIGSGAKKNGGTFLQYVESQGDQFAVYTLAENKWRKKLLPFFAPYAGADEYCRDIKSATLLRDYVATAVYEVTLDGRSVGKGFEAGFGMMSGQKVEIPEEMLADIGDLTYTLTIDKAAGIPVKAEIDMTALTAYLTEKILLADMPAEQKIALRQMFTDTKATLIVAFSRPDAVGKLAIPPEALAAPLDKKATPAPAQSTGKE